MKALGRAAWILVPMLGLGASSRAQAPSDVPEAEAPPPSSVRPSVDVLLRQLERRQAQLERRESTLATREADLRAVESELDARLAELQALRAELDTRFETLNAEQEAKAQDLVKMFEAMRGSDCAAILAVTEDPVALAVLDRMNVTKAGKALAAMDPPRAARLAEKLGRPLVLTGSGS